MSARDNLDAHALQFDVPKGQLAHELTMLILNKCISGKEDTDDVYDRYIEILGEISARIDGQTRYESNPRKWMEATPLGKSEFDGPGLPV